MALKHDDTIMTQEGLSSSEDELQGDGMDDVIEQDENEELEAEDESMSDSDSEIVKDDTELELEKLVFGDSAGFRSQLRTFNADSSGRSGHALPDQDGDGAEKEEALAAVDDADLFFLDAAPDLLDVHVTTTTTDHPDNALTTATAPAAWHDSDDERMTISLTSVPRLKKLREFDGEDLIDGNEYIRRLRKQYQILNPTPQWATWSATHTRRRGHKRRRLSHSSHDGASSEEDAPTSTSGDEAEAEAGDEEASLTSAQPLAALLRSANPLTATAPSTKNASARLRLRPEVLSIQRLPDLVPAQPSAINSLCMHPTLPLLLSSGPSSTLYLHHIYPHPVPPQPSNPLLTSLHLKHTPLTTTAFSPSATTPLIYLAARRRYFHTWSLASGALTKVTRVYGHQHDTVRSMERLVPSPCGRYVALAGQSGRGAAVIHVLSAATLQWTAQAALDDAPGGLATFVWWRGGDGLTLVGRGGEVAEWSLERRRVVARWQDEGAVGITTAALGGSLLGGGLRRGTATPTGTDRWAAVGSTSGIVNIYDRAAWLSGAEGLPPRHPKPMRVLDNLVTPVSQLVFSRDAGGQLLCMSSRWKKDALRLVHLPSGAVYRNWPTGKTPLGRVSAVALGEHVEAEGAGGEAGEKRMVLVVGNEAGALRMWEIKA